MAGPGEIIAQRLGGVRPQKQRARSAQTLDQRARIFNVHFKVLGRKTVGQRDRFVERTGDGDQAPVAQRGGGDVFARQGRELRFKFARHVNRERGAVGQEHA